MRTSYEERDLTDKFGDVRLCRRFNTITRQLREGLTRSIPEAAKTRAETKAMYRFFDNKAVSPQKMLSIHYNEFGSSISNSQTRRFLQLSDSTELDLTRKKGSKDLGPLNYINRRGMWLHNSMILNERGAPLGLLHQNYIVRKDEDFGKAAERTALPFEQKESYRWKEHFLKGQSLCEEYPWLEGVYIADREADIMELFQSRTCEGMHFIIRSKHDRKLSDKSGNLYSHLFKQPFQGAYQVTLTHPATKKKRVAKVEVYFCEVSLQLHNTLPIKRGLPPISLYAVGVKEIDPPEDIEEPINWVLLTTLEVKTFEQALQVIDYYILRWLIERFHFLLKTGGAEVEELQLQKAHRLKNAITAYSIAAVNAFKMRYWAEKSPQTQIYDIGITPVEHKVLYTYAKQNIDSNVNFDSDKPPDVREFCRILGQIGGFFPSKRQPLPGFRILSRSIVKLNILVDAYLTFCQRPPE